HWLITTSPLGDGSYTIIGSATDKAGKVSSVPTALFPTASRGPLVVDTAGPQILSASLNAKTGKLTLLLQDTGSGLNQPALTNPPTSTSSPTGRTLPAPGLPVSPAVPTNLQTLTATFSAGKLAKGNYVLRISAAGLTDNAGNALNEKFFVPFPGIYNTPGQD